MRDQPLATDLSQKKRVANAHVDRAAPFKFAKVAIQAVRKSGVATYANSEVAHLDSNGVFRTS